MEPFRNGGWKPEHAAWGAIENAQERMDKLNQMLARRLVEKDAAALRYLLASEDGRWFLMRFFERCHLLSTAKPDIQLQQNFFVWEGERRSALETYQGILMPGQEGLEGKQLAEREYYAFQKEQDRLRKEAEEGDEADD